MSQRNRVENRVGGCARTGSRPAGIGGVQLIQTDPLDAKGAAAVFARRRQVFGPAVGLPAAVRTDDSSLGRDRDARSIALPGGESPADEALVVAAFGVVQAV